MIATTTSNVLQLKVVEAPYNLQAVDLLEDLLERAKSGEVLELVFCAKLLGGEYEQSYTGCSDLHELIGQLERMKFLTLRRMDK